MDFTIHFLWSSGTNRTYRKLSVTFAHVATLRTLKPFMNRFNRRSRITAMLLAKNNLDRYLWRHIPDFPWVFQTKCLNWRSLTFGKLFVNFVIRIYNYDEKYKRHIMITNVGKKWKLISHKKNYCLFTLVMTTLFHIHRVFHHYVIYPNPIEYQNYYLLHFTQ